MTATKTIAQHAHGTCAATENNMKTIYIKDQDLDAAANLRHVPAPQVGLGALQEKIGSTVAEALKRCTKCSEQKLASSFSKDKQKRDGLSCICKDCDRAKALDWAKNNPEKRKLKNDKWQADNPDIFKSLKAAWRARNLEKTAASSAAYRATNREKLSLSQASYRAENPEKYAANRAAWRKANPTAGRLYGQNRRALKVSGGGKLSKDLAKKLFSLQQGKCPCCKQPLGDDYQS